MNNPENTVNDNSVQEVEEIQQPIERRHRRTKFDNIERGFVCQCGKSYLSYPALYTHYKTKHNVNTQLNSKPESHKKRGNKSKSDSHSQSGQQKNILRQAQTFLITRINYINTLLNEENTARTKRISKEGQLYVQKIIKYWAQHTKQQLKYENQVYSATIDQVFGLFLFAAKAEFNARSYSFFEKLITDMHKGLNQLNGDSLYCEATSAIKLPLDMNGLFTQNLSKIYCQQMHFKNRTLICLAICHFNSWLLEEEFTNLNLRLNIV